MRRGGRDRPALALGVRTKGIRSLTVAALIGLTAATANAQSGGGYLIKKSTIDSGGGMVTGGDYRLTGTAQGNRILT
jgi:hypothetical protein